MGQNPAQALGLSRLDALRHETDEAIRRASEGDQPSPGRSFVAALLAPAEDG